MNEIGGFFELELPIRDEYHKDAIKLNTARNSLEYILKANKYNKIFLPYYICSSVLEAVNKTNTIYDFYSINYKFEPEFEFEHLNEGDLFLYVNYFGICSKNVDKLIEKSQKEKFNLCIDNTQAFFSYPRGEKHTIYSARKYFGVPDGAYLYTDKLLNEEIEREIAYDKSSHLIKRIDLDANLSYGEFKKNSRNHSNQSIKKMSRLSERILNSIEYDEVIQKRNKNFEYIHSNLQKYNKLSIDMNIIYGPMIYPLLVTNGDGLRKILIDNKIYVAQYWNEVLKNVEKNSVEENLTIDLIAIPIDQRYSLEDMDLILCVIKNYLNRGENII
ncbi:MAG: hypothetical protein ACRCVJ_03935 [Clostridium sp.]|uniref:hypothetical protein n=1 Tax=Clostridium sp. TaxID=1506 RepID=UPI003F3F7AE7